MNKWFNKLTKVFIVIGMILSMCFSAGNTTSVEAWDNTIPHEFTRIKEINYPWWWSKKIGSTKQWSTVMTKYNGKYAYCLEASKKSPSAGNYPAEVIDNNEAVRKLLYYGFGGPGYNQAVRDMYTIELNSCVPDDFGDKHGNFDDGAYLFTHIWLSYAYSGDLMGLNLKDFNTKWPNGDGVSGYGDNILWGYNWIMSQPDIGYAKWNPTDSKYGTSTKLTASYDPANRIQYTNTVTLEGNNAQANLTLQDEVTLHNVTTGETQTGGTYTLNAAQSFYLTAPNKNISDYQSNNVAGAGCERFTVLAIKDGASGTQTEGSWEIDPDSRQLYYSVDWLDFGDVEIQKLGIGQDNHQSGLVEGLNGAEFTLKLQSEVNEKSWDNASTYDVITTANNSNGKKGYATTTNLPYGKYIIRETKTPDGYVTCPDLIYEISKETDNITLNNDITTAYVKLVKKDAKTGKTVSLNSASFKIKNKETDEYVTQKVGKTKYSVFTTNSKNQVVVKDEYSSSDDEEGSVTTPLKLSKGDYEITEIKTPKGFLDLDAPVEFSILNEVDLTKDDDGDNVVEIAINNEQPTGSIKLIKKDYDTKEALKDVGFKLTADQDVIDDADGSIIYHENEVIGEYTTDENGEINIADLPINAEGKTVYTMVETKPLDGYATDDTPIKFEFSQKDTTTKVYTVDKSMTNEKVEIHTTATSDDNHEAQEQETITIKDKVSYKGLVKGKEYTVKGVLMDKKTNQPLLVDGKEVTAETTFTAEDRTGSVDVEFTFKGTGLSKKKIVVFEDMYEKDRLLASHSDIEDEDQTVNIIDIHTSANINSNKEITVDNNADTTIKLIDTVSYEGLTVGKEYTLKGTLHTKDGKVFKVDDKEVTAQTSFIPETEDGTVDVEFEFDVKDFTGGQLVVFEKLFDDQKDEIAKHEDKDDEGQTVDIKRTDNVEISKQDITTKKELEGAKLKVTDKNGNVVDEWTSTKETHMIENLTIGETYTLTEEIAPKNYKVAESVNFKIENNGKVVQKVVMYDELLPVAKKVKTGDNTQINYYIIIAGLSLLAISLLVIRKKSHG
ncbi:hypothetical protein DW660_04875 [Coprobacillus sp. AM23-9LB]|mgnify:FL=1|jgi:hypothetical protein|uniref:VaFE repeat-containing surface-anchored protein n=1 Tax=Faecalibacillus intestinalis TaxID=1982626 RepID=UPI000E40BBC4|nr:VaFE repeat-containing surface-anchored protein [Faecalibacillus intestinalis]RGE96292.1 hypothetical protein DW660_04875 [Coprobacillus sp. AM23-9LB]